MTKDDECLGEEKEKREEENADRSQGTLGVTHFFLPVG
jgi:hypothetical protein